MFVKYITNNLITNNATKKRGLIVPLIFMLVVLFSWTRQIAFAFFWLRPQNFQGYCMTNNPFHAAETPRTYEKTLQFYPKVADTSDTETCSMGFGFDCFSGQCLRLFLGWFRWMVSLWLVLLIIYTQIYNNFLNYQHSKKKINKKKRTTCPPSIVCSKLLLLGLCLGTRFR